MVSGATMAPPYNSSTPNAMSLAALHLEEAPAAHIGRFLRRVASARTVFAVAAEDGLARTASHHMSGREVALLWSEREAAMRWAASLASNTRIKELRLEELFAGLLPALAEHRRLVGTDWCGETGEPELDPRELAEKIRLELLEAFLARAIMFGAVWTLGDRDGPVMLVSATRPNVLMMPCWSDERQAEARQEGPWIDTVTMRIRLEDFMKTTLPGLGGQGFLVAPEHIAGPGVIELEADDLKARIAARQVIEI